MTEIDPVAVLDSLGYGRREGLEAMTGGWANAMWRFDTADGARHVLRVYPHPEWAPAALREQAALQAAAAGGIPVPALEVAGTWHDLAVMVLSWCPGEPLLNALRRRPWKVWALGGACGRLQARIHAITPPQRLLEGAPEYWLAVARAGYPQLDSLIDRIGISTASLVHFDYHPLNILTDGHTITGVVDWATAAAGDPRADVARTVAALSAAPLPPGPLRPLLSAVRGLLLRRWLHGYRAEAGDIGDIAPFVALTGVVYLHDFQQALEEGRGWASERDLATFNRWVERWKAKAGLEGGPQTAQRG